MKPTSIALIALASCACAPSAVPETPQVETGDPLPAAGPEPAACRRGFRWLGSDPHVPLATSSARGIREAGVDCCAAWARAGDVWTAVDAWGAPLGDHAITGGEGYDVTQCYELTLDVPAAALLVRGDRRWRAPKSARWEPDAGQRAALLELAATFDRVFEAPLQDEPRPGDVKALPLEERVVFFELPADPRDDRVATHFAAVGGRALLLAALDRQGRWRTQYVDTDWGFSAGPWRDDVYRVIAVFDMDGDGFAEVIVHRNEGPAWDDVILRTEPDSTLRSWHVVAASVGGSTA